MARGCQDPENFTGFRVSQAVDACSPSTLRWLSKLIAYPTISGTQSNLDMLSEVEYFLARMGFEIRRTSSDDGLRANLFASLGGSVGGLLLSGHTDVVPIAGQPWTRKPFTLSEDVNRFYGRGVCDMKGFIAVVLGMIEQLGVAAIAKPFHLALTYDEEIGCIGVRRMLADLQAQGIQPAACVVGEPTQLQIVRAHKGRYAMRCKVQGQAAHSSLSGQGVNALEVASRLVAEIAQQSQALQASRCDEDFYIPYSTLAACRFQSGFASNVIPAEAEFDFDLRFLPGEEPEVVLQRLRETADAYQEEMRTRVPQSSVIIEQRTAVPALAANAETDKLVKNLMALGAKLGSHAAFTTESGLYQQQGIPTVVCGPGDIAQAHTADEYIEKNQISQYEAVMKRLLQAGVSMVP
jgi:acetylornithine deacetylase